MRKSISYLVIAALFTALFPASSLAQTGLTITPPFTDVTLTKDSQVEELRISLTNHTDSRLTLALSTIDFGSLNESGGLLFAGNKQDEVVEAHKLTPWLKLASPSMVIEPKATETVSLSIVNDPAMSPGGHYGAVLATVESSVDPVTGQSQRVVIHQAISSLLFVTKQGGERFGLTLDEFNLKRPWWGTVDRASAKLRNSGNVHVVPRGLVKITDPAGRVVGQGALNLESAMVLPQKFRVLDAAVKPLGLWLWPGRYQASIEYRYEGADAIQASTTHFWHLGLVGWGTIGLIIASFLIFLIWRFRRRSNFGGYA
jgi:hypothetical protein